MMTIEEYFDRYFDTHTEDEYDAEQSAAWDAMQSDDDDAWETWKAAHPEIDFEAQEEVMGEMIYVTVLWAWDMCGD